MTFVRRLGVMVLAAFVSACVTVNVYFPAAAAERVADKIVREVYGVGAGDRAPATEPKQEAPAPAPSGEPGAGLERVLEFLVASAYAQAPDIDVSSPAIEALTASLRARHAQLAPHYASGAIGLSANGLIVLRDPQAVPLKDRQTLAAVVADENRDRNALYGEIATANGHPEWEQEIRLIFDRRWVANAPAGWWFENADGNWVQK